MLSVLEVIQRVPPTCITDTNFTYQRPSQQVFQGCDVVQHPSVKNVNQGIVQLVRSAQFHQTVQIHLPRVQMQDHSFHFLQLVRLAKMPHQCLDDPCWQRHQPPVQDVRLQQLNKRVLLPGGVETENVKENKETSEGRVSQTYKKKHEKHEKNEKIRPRSKSTLKSTPKLYKHVFVYFDPPSYECHQHVQ